MNKKIELIQNPAELSSTENLIYVQKMEEIFRKKTEYYLWSHRRLEHKRPPEIPFLV